jgi:tetratricopeptide (TPR) repeat protein
LLLVAGPAHGQGGNAAAAEALFQEALKLQKQQRYDEACPKLAESHRLDPGTGVLLHLGDCYARIGKTASAWAAYQEALPRARREANEVRVQAAQQGIAAVTPRLARLTIVVPPASNLAGLVVRSDGVEQAPATWGSALPLDPGEHVVEVTAPGRAPFRTKVTLVEGGPEPTTVTIPVLHEQQAAASGPPSDDSAPAAPAGGGEAQPSSAAGLSDLATAGLAVGAVGLAAVAAAVVTGALVLGDRSTIEDECDEAARTCTQTGLDARDSQDTLSVVNTVAWAVGIAGVGAGLAMLLAGGQHAAPEQAFVPFVAPGAAGGLFVGRF